MWGLVAGLGWTVAVLSVVTAVRMRSSLNRTHHEAGEVGPDESVPIRAILDSLPLGVIVVDESGVEYLRNAAARHSTSSRHESVLVDAVVERLSRSAVGGATATEQMQLVGPPLRVLVISAVPSSQSGAVITIEDITERWRVDQVRTDFVANVSHELKTPVGAISILAETLENEIDDDLAKTLVHRMVLESHRMAQTIDDLLELSRVQLGGEMHLERFDVTDAAREAVERSLPLATKRGVTVDCVSTSDDTTIMGDRFQILSAIGNLVDNAVKYSDDNQTVTVKVEATPSDVNLQVIDHGIGIPVSSIDRIFERFYRVDKARSRGTGGTGLGLAIVRHVATNHGGEVNVRSREGEGSTFILRLPRVRPSASGTIVINDNSLGSDSHGHSNEPE
jgi:two-component system, OmpR family, sensor histidine kinase SenX3